MAELKGGLLIDSSVTQSIIQKLEHGSVALKDINGIVIHQTDSPTAQSTINAWKSGRKNPKTGAIEYYGAHFLIDRGSGNYEENGKQIPYKGIDGKIYQTAHATQKCLHVAHLKSKTYPTNSHSIGIELVARFNEKDGYPDSSVAQVESAMWLVKTLIELISSVESLAHVYAHGAISSGKKPSEGVSSLEQIKKEAEKKKTEQPKEITIHSSIPFVLPRAAVDNTRVVMRFIPTRFVKE